MKTTQTCRNMEKVQRLHAYKCTSVFHYHQRDDRGYGADIDIWSYHLASPILNKISCIARNKVNTQDDLICM